MFAPSSSSIRGVVVAAAVALTGTAALGQQMANTSTLPDRAAYLAAQCDHLYNDPPRHAGCYAEKAIEFNRARTEAAKRTVANQETTLAAQSDLQRCIGFLQQKKAGGTAFDRTITRDNACPYARELGLN